MEGKKFTVLAVVLLIILVGALIAGNKFLAQKEKQATSPGQIFSAANPQVRTLEVGEEAPNFQVTTIDDKTFTLDSFSDKILVVTSGAAWCPTCILEAKNMNPVFQEFKDKEVEFMTVDIDPIDDEKAVAAFQRQYAPWHNIHSAQAQKMIKDYGFWRFEITYIIKNGRVRFADVAITDTEVLRSELNKVLQN